MANLGFVRTLQKLIMLGILHVFLFMILIANIVEGVDSHRYHSYWKAGVIVLMGFDNTHVCRIIVFGSSVSCSESMTN